MSASPTPAQILPSDEGSDHMIIDGAAELLSESKQRVALPKKLVHSEHTFVLAGTGFGKTQIAEMYSKLFKPYQKAVIVVVNPLDAIQVEEKKDVGVDHKTIQAINLTKDTLTAVKLMLYEYNCAFQSPEAFLNSEML